MAVLNKFSRGRLFALSLIGVCFLTACSSVKPESSGKESTLGASGSGGDTLKLLYWQAPTIPRIQHTNSIL
jgi:peptide/nickel transport system substrate-binding protein